MDLTTSEKINLGTKEICRRIREQLKTEFTNSKFSVTHKYFSMGSEINISLMESHVKIIKDFSEIPEQAIYIAGTNSYYTPENIQERQNKNYHQLNHFTFHDNYDPMSWNNGVYLTQEGFNLLKRVYEIIRQYHYDKSDPMTDYSNTNFYIHIDIGKWDKPFIQLHGIT